jgi:hypothetical protein
MTSGHFRLRLDDVDGGDGAEIDAAAVLVELPKLAVNSGL